MQNNLEGISFDEVINETGTSYTVFRTTLRPRYTKVLSDIIKGYFFLLLTSSLVFLSGQTYPSLWWLYIPAGSILIGYIAAYIALFI
ncbi:MAG TPA: hypothetical protein PKI55_13910, partial [Chitinophagaceae bacterium]|nr:hypothetical protein [Chitinophagaceae bacterium]